MSVYWGLIGVIRIATTQLEATHVVAILDTLSTAMDTCVMVGSALIYSAFQGRYFADNDECSSDATNDCHHICVNTPGSYICQCRLGYRLNADGRTCSGMYMRSMFSA